VPFPVFKQFLLGPTSYIVKALYDRELLLDKDGNPPPWAFEPRPSRVSQIFTWCNSRNIIPVLLLDEVADIREADDN